MNKSDEKDENGPWQILEGYREEIDSLDRQLIDLLSKRFDIVRAVGKLKADHDIGVVQSKRADEVKLRAMNMAEEKGVNPYLIRGFYDAMIDEAHIIEHEIKDKNKKDNA